ncbi:unnamed protein product, partial [Ectocarpus sp. 12 AP-2014]
DYYKRHGERGKRYTQRTNSSNMHTIGSYTNAPWLRKKKRESFKLQVNPAVEEGLLSRERKYPLPNEPQPAVPVHGTHWMTTGKTRLQGYTNKVYSNTRDRFLRRRN